MWQRIGVPAPSWRGLSSEVFMGVEVLERHGFVPQLGSIALGRPRFNTPFADVDARAAEFIGMLRDDSLEAIWCLDGGGGAIYLLPYLEKAWNEQPWNVNKPVIGYSDCTHLLMYLSKLGHVCFFASPVAVEEEFDREKVEAHAAFFAGLEPGQLVETAPPVEVFRAGKVEGELIGGTFTCFTNLVGTRFCPCFQDKILFFEEHGDSAPGQYEYLLWQRLSGLQMQDVLGGCVGALVGGIETFGPYETKEDLFDDLWTVLEKTLVPSIPTGPIVSGFPYGSLVIGQPLPLGVRVSLEAGEGCCKVAWEVPDRIFGGR